MKEHKIYFELFGKKMCTTVTANSRDQAKEIIREKIIFHKIEVAKNKDDDFIDDFLKGFGKW